MQLQLHPGWLYEVKLDGYRALTTREQMHEFQWRTPRVVAQIRIT